MEAASLVVEEHPAAEDINFLNERINEFNFAATQIYDGKELAIFVRDGEGQIRPDMPPRPMSFYAVTKLMGERMTYAASQREGLDVICLRLGIARPGANLPSKRVGLWEQQKWLGNTDACRAIEAAVFHPHKGWAAVFATSNNTGMRWSLEESRAAIGYEPTESSTPVPPSFRSRTVGSVKKHLRRICARMSGEAG